MTNSPRYDRTLRIVMWLDAWLSVAMVAVCLVAAPIVATVGVPYAVQAAVGLASAVSAVLLAAFGATTGVLLMLRMRAGHYLLPPGMRPPLPSGINPFTDDARSGALSTGAVNPARARLRPARTSATDRGARST